MGLYMQCVLFNFTYLNFMHQPGLTRLIWSYFVQLNVNKGFQVSYNQIHFKLHLQPSDRNAEADRGISRCIFLELPQHLTS